MLIILALLLRKTLASCKTPCSVNAKGRYRWPPQLEITICDLKFRLKYLYAGISPISVGIHIIFIFLNTLWTRRKT